jgi:tetratricopeptide (TPR) repeat protein
VVIAAFTAQSSYDTIKYVASEELQNDIEILKLAVKGHNDAFGHIPENWRTNKELIELVLAGEVSSSSFEHFPIEYRDNEEIAKKVVGDDAGCFRYLSERLRNNKELAIIAVSGVWHALGEMPDAMLDDKDVVLSAVQNHNVGGLIMNISDRLKSDIDIVIAAVSKDNRALEYFPDEFKDNENFYINMGSVCADKGDYDKALEWYQKCLDIELKTLGAEHPSVANSYNNIGLVYANKGDHDKAREWFQKWVDI